MSNKNTVDTRKFRAVITNIQKDVKVAAKEAVGTTIEQSRNFAMSFDDVETAPWIKNEAGKIVISTSGENSSERLEQLLLEQTPTIMSALESNLASRLKEVLR